MIDLTFNIKSQGKIVLNVGVVRRNLWVYLGLKISLLHDGLLIKYKWTKLANG